MMRTYVLHEAYWSQSNFRFHFPMENYLYYTRITCLIRNWSRNKMSQFRLIFNNREQASKIIDVSEYKSIPERM